MKYSQFDLNSIYELSTQRPILHYAVRHATPEIIKYILSEVEDPNPKDNLFYTPFHTALAIGEVEMIGAFLPRVGKDHSLWNCCNEIGNPLIFAIEGGNLDVIQAIEPFVDFEPKHCCLSFPLHRAAELGKRDIYDYLLSKVSDNLSLNENGETAQDLIKSFAE